MTESEWLASQDLRELLIHACTEGPPGRRRAFAADGIERVHHLFDAVNGPIADAFVRWVRGEGADPATLYPKPGFWPMDHSLSAGHTVNHWLPYLIWGGVHYCLLWLLQAEGEDRTERSEALPAVRAEQVARLRDIFGNPFRPVVVEPAWLTPTVVALARGIYEGRAFDLMPILADALQDAECDSPDILTHCRSDGPHVRGCWVVDLLLAKS